MQALARLWGQTGGPQHWQALCRQAQNLTRDREPGGEAPRFQSLASAACVGEGSGWAQRYHRGAPARGPRSVQQRAGAKQAPGWEGQACGEDSARPAGHRPHQPGLSSGRPPLSLLGTEDAEPGLDLTRKWDLGSDRPSPRGPGSHPLDSNWGQREVGVRPHTSLGGPTSTPASGARRSPSELRLPCPSQ